MGLVHFGAKLRIRLRYNRFHPEMRSSQAGVSLPASRIGTSAPDWAPLAGEKEMSLINNNGRAAQGEGGSSSLQSGDGARRDGMEVVSPEAQAPIVDTSWDPYQVWLTRVKQPREQSARTRRQARAAAEPLPGPDLSETARLRTLRIVG